MYSQGYLGSLGECRSLWLLYVAMCRGDLVQCVRWSVCLTERGEGYIQAAHPGFRLHSVSLGTRKQTTNTLDPLTALPKHHFI